ncbi:MAG TPA: hypothetical protein VIP54_10970 [Microterricola sp.]
MSHGNELRNFYIAVALIAVVSITLGLIVGIATGQYAWVFIAQILIAGLLGVWRTRIKRRSTATK